MATGTVKFRVAIWRPGRCKSGSPYGGRIAHTSGRHIVTGTVQIRVAIWRPACLHLGSPYGDQYSTSPGRHMATGLLPTTVAIWRRRWFEPRSPFGDRVAVRPYPRMATQLDLANTSHSRLVFIDFSFELRSHCHSFRLDRSYRWNFTRNTAKTCFSRIGSS